MARCPVLLDLPRRRAAPVSLAPLVSGRAGNGEDGRFERRVEPGPRLDYLGQVM